MHIEYRECRGTGVLRIVMLFASDLICSGVNPCAIIARVSRFNLLPSCDFDRSAPFVRRISADVWSRQAVGSAPKSLSFHLAVPRASPCFTFGIHILADCLSIGFLQMFSFRLLPILRSDPGFPCTPSGPPGANRWQRASRGICGSLGLAPKSLPSVFSDAAAGIAATPIRLNFPVNFHAVKLES
jgi:hypothetical protein